MKLVLRCRQSFGSLFFIVIFFFSHEIAASWILTQIENQSDVRIIQAARYNNVEIPSISRQLISVSKSHRMFIDPASLFGSSGNCKIIAFTPEGKQVSFCFFGDPTYRVANGRALYADTESRNAAAAIKQPLLARVFIMYDDVVKLVGFSGYEYEGQQFAMKLLGDKGSYVVQLLSIGAR